MKKLCLLVLLGMSTPAIAEEVLIVLSTEGLIELNQEFETYGQSEYEKLAYAINQEAKENYLLSQEEIEAAKDAASSLGFNPNEVVYVSASTTDGLSVRHKGVELANSQNEDHGAAVGKAVIFLGVAVGLAAILSSGGGSGSDDSRCYPTDGVVQIPDLEETVTYEDGEVLNGYQFNESEQTMCKI